MQTFNPNFGSIVVPRTVIKNALAGELVPTCPSAPIDGPLLDGIIELETSLILWMVYALYYCCCCRCCCCCCGGQY